MGDIQPNFSRSEFDVSGTVPSEYEGNVQALAGLLQQFRDMESAALGRPVPIVLTSVYRSLEHNQAVYANVPNATSLKAYTGSQHLTASAADGIHAATDREVADALFAAIGAGAAPYFGQVIFYDDEPHIHISLPRTSEPNMEVLLASKDANGNRVFQTVSAPADVPAVTSFGKAALAAGGLLRGGNLARPASEPQPARVGGARLIPGHAWVRR